MIRVAILGSTGSIGRSTLEVIDRHPERFEVVALAAGTSLDALAEQVRRYRPAVAVLADEDGMGPTTDLPPRIGSQAVRPSCPSRRTLR